MGNVWGLTTPGGGVNSIVSRPMDWNSDAEVAEWQTRWTQNPVPARACGFKSHLRYLHAKRCSTLRTNARSSDFVGAFCAFYSASDARPSARRFSAPRASPLIVPVNPAVPVDPYNTFRAGRYAAAALRHQWSIGLRLDGRGVAGYRDSNQVTLCATFRINRRVDR